MVTSPADEFTLAQDAEDRRAALAAAVSLAGINEYTMQHVIAPASLIYAWLRRRDTLRAFYVFIVPLTRGTAFTEGNTPMDTTYSGSNDGDIVFTLSGVDSRNSQVPVPSDTWSWSLADPDSSGAVLNVAADALSVTVTPGTPTSSLVLSVAGASTGDQAQCAITITAGAAVGVEIVPPAPAPLP
ncbi:MAG TPA: hypothetical protein VNH17_08030 [Streptosporangiaceae bacterium]|nr:hypothetical protein [Streptosporangiaceae bacterium]